MVILDFFRDFFSGIMYWLYVLVCIFAFFYVLGIVADRKRLAISVKLKEKKTYDIESGREAAIAAMESKQVLDVEEDATLGTNPVENQTLAQQATQSQQPTLQAQLGNPVPNQAKEEAPQVMVLNSAEVQDTPKQVEPVVISSTPTITPVQNTTIQQ